MSSDKFDLAWNRVLDWLTKHRPGIYESLNPPASDEEIASIEKYYGVAVPEDLKKLYRLHDGQDESEKGIVNFFYGELFLPISYSLSYHEGAYASDFKDRGWEEYTHVDKEIDPTLKMCFMYVSHR